MCPSRLFVHLQQGPENGLPEIACTSPAGGDITSGGGFSSLYAMPPWQSTAVNGYHARVKGTAKEPFRGFATGGRGYPDVALAANSYLVAVNRSAVVVSGTSASAPVFAGMVARVNHLRLKAGKSPLGWINPALYSLFRSFTNDVTEGQNNCGADAVICCEQGFHAAVGWDPVTGLGSVNYGKFAKAFMSVGDIKQPTAMPTPAAGAPTVMPVTLKPSAQPTATPTTATGFLVQSQYVGAQCSNASLLKMEGFRTNLCLQTNTVNTTTGMNFYSKFHCDRGEEFNFNSNYCC